MLLKDGTEVEDPRLDRLYEEDWRSLDYPVTRLLASRGDTHRARLSRVPVKKIWTLDRTLDQGPDGACVGFAFAHDLLAPPQILTTVQNVSINDQYAKERIYWEAQKIDEWTGGSYPGGNPFYEGTSVLAGAKVIKNYSIYNSYYWALDLRQLVLGVSHEGPCVFGINWYDSMFTPNAQNFVSPGGGVAGGHAVLITGVNPVYTKRGIIPVSQIWRFIDLDKSWFKLKNSWGASWGEQGNFYMTFRNANRLLNEQGDACFPVRKI